MVGPFRRESKDPHLPSSDEGDLEETIMPSLGLAQTNGKINIWGVGCCIGIPGEGSVHFR